MIQKQYFVGFFFLLKIKVYIAQKVFGNLVLILTLYQEIVKKKN